MQDFLQPPASFLAIFSYARFLAAHASFLAIFSELRKMSNALRQTRCCVIPCVTVFVCDPRSLSVCLSDKLSDKPPLNPAESR